MNSPTFRGNTDVPHKNQNKVSGEKKKTVSEVLTDDEMSNEDFCFLEQLQYYWID